MGGQEDHQLSSQQHVKFVPTHKFHEFFKYFLFRKCFNSVLRFSFCWSFCYSPSSGELADFFCFVQVVVGLLLFFFYSPFGGVNIFSVKIFVSLFSGDISKEFHLFSSRLPR